MIEDWQSSVNCGVVDSKVDRSIPNKVRQGNVQIYAGVRKEDVHSVRGIVCLSSLQVRVLFYRCLRAKVG